MTPTQEKLFNEASNKTYCMLEKEVLCGFRTKDKKCSYEKNCKYQAKSNKYK